MGVVHELGLVSGVAAAVRRQVADRPTARVVTVALQVGELSGAVEEALHAAWPLVATGQLSGARLITTMVPATVWCPGCAAEQPIDAYFALTCPVCGTPTADLRHGREFEIDYCEVATPD